MGSEFYNSGLFIHKNGQGMGMHLFNISAPPFDKLMHSHKQAVIILLFAKNT